MIRVAIAMLAVIAGAPAASRRVARPTAGSVSAAAFTTVDSISAVPLAASFTSIVPDAPVSAVPSVITVALSHSSGRRLWTLSVASASAWLQDCAAVPASALVLQCASVEVKASGSGSCSQLTRLSAVPQVIASGTEPPGKGQITVTVNISFTDSWKFPAAINPSCSTDLTWTVSAQ
ncbi:MAG TPA: hypothetical protein VFA04_15460 [Bryobacteraceae bacterium]|nr:hypothetical protein [Bryobacteraceae bacterium]